MSAIFSSQAFCAQFFESLKLFFLTSKVTYKLFKNKCILLLRSCPCCSEGSPSSVLRSSIQGIEDWPPQRMRLRSDCSPWGIPIRSWISIGLSYKCITVCILSLGTTLTAQQNEKNPHACLLNLVSGICTKDIKRNHSVCSGALVSALSISSLFSYRAAISAAGGRIWYLKVVAHTEQAKLISEVNRGTNKIQAQLWVISVSLLATKRTDIWFPDTKVSLATKFQWCS